MDEQAAGGVARNAVSGTADTWPLSAREAAAMLGVSERTVRRAILRGMLPAIKHGGVYQIAPADLARYRKERLSSHPTDIFALSPLPSSMTAQLPASGTIPRPPTPLIGRQSEITAVLSMLDRDDVRLLTLTGPGGVGKSRLAVAVAVAAVEAETFKDGARFVPLAPVRDTASVVPAIMRALAVPDIANQPAIDVLCAFLAVRELLLVLDNFEHLLAAAPNLMVILARCRHVKLLVTSRAVLHLSGEQQFAVPPLRLPAASDQTSLAAIAASEAGALFQARAQAVRADFVLAEINAAAVTEICRRLDGLPLAIELAAARINLLPPAALLARLEPRLPLLTGGPNDHPARLRTMRDAIAWSYDLLSAEEQTLFRRLGVFDGGVILEAAEWVMREHNIPSSITYDSSPNVFDLVASLVDKSLLRQMSQARGEPRFVMFETIREYALTQLAASGEEEATRRRYAEWALSYAARLDALLDEYEERRWLDCLDAERANLHSAFDWWLAAGDAEASLRLGAAVLDLWFSRGPVSEGRTWLRRALAMPGSKTATPASRILALHSASLLAWMQRDVEEASMLAEESRALAQASGDDEARGWSLNLLGLAATAGGDTAEAASYFDASLAIYRALGLFPTTRLAMVLMNRAVVADPPEARRYLEEALAITPAINYKGTDTGMLLLQLGRVARLEGSTQEAARHFGESLRIGVETDDLWILSQALVNLADLAERAGRLERAVNLLAAAADVRETHGVPIKTADLTEFARAVRRVRTRLSDPAFARAWAKGSSLPFATIIADAMSLAQELAASPHPGVVLGADALINSLTRREREVLDLLKDGATDGEIAAALFISPRTVGTHVSAILRKFGVENRRGARAYAQAHDLHLG